MNPSQVETALAHSSPQLEAFEAGLISRGSVMVNGMTARQMVARAVLVGMPVGLHLNLTEGLPLSPPSAIPSLVTMDPEYGKAVFWGKGAFHARAAEGLLDPADVRTEAQAQLDALERMLEAAQRRSVHGGGDCAPHPSGVSDTLPPTGGVPARGRTRGISHVDGHQHCHVHPGLAAVLGPLFAEHRVPSIRLPLLSRAEDQSEALASGGSHYTKRAFIERVSALAAVSRAVYAACGLRAPIAFVGFACMGREMRRSRRVAALVVAAHRQATAGLASLESSRRRSDLRLAASSASVGLDEVELMSHPGNATTPDSVRAAATRFPASADAPSSAASRIEALAGCGCGPDAFAASDDRLQETTSLAAVGAELRALGASVAVCVGD